jgi:hypothetical protein
MENVLEKDITGHIGTQKYLCTLLLGGTANLLWTNPSVLMERPWLILFHS